MPSNHYEKGARGPDHRPKGNKIGKSSHKTIIREIIEPVYYDNEKNFVCKT